MHGAVATSRFSGSRNIGNTLPRDWRTARIHPQAERRRDAGFSQR
jgi:hypothetical protein